MPKPKPPSESPVEQHKRFKEVARECGADETGTTFEAAFKKAVPEAKPKKDTD